MNRAKEFTTSTRPDAGFVSFFFGMHKYRTSVGIGPLAVKNTSGAEVEECCQYTE